MPGVAHESPPPAFPPLQRPDCCMGAFCKKSEGTATVNNLIQKYYLRQLTKDFVSHLKTNSDTTNGLTSKTQNTRGSGSYNLFARVSQSVPENLCPLHACHRPGVRTFSRGLTHEADQQLYRSIQSWVWTLAARLPPRRAPTCASLFTDSRTVNLAL